MIAKFFQYLGIPNFIHDFDNINQITKEDDSVYGLGGGLHDINPVLKLKPSQADEILGKDICKWLFDNYNWYYKKFNYQK